MKKILSVDPAIIGGRGREAPLWFTAELHRISREQRGMALMFTASPREQSVIVWALGQITAALR